MTDNKARLSQLESVLAQMLQPLRNIPLSVVVKALTKHDVIPIDRKSPDDKALIERLSKAAKICGKATQSNPIVRPRPNEVGNDIEPYVMEGIRKSGLSCERPRTAKGALKTTGYPDVLILDAKKRPSYLECKIYGAGSEPTSMRSFYLSPSDNAKICRDARHLLMAFEMEAAPISGSRSSSYMARAFKLVDLHDLLCDVKYEFNSDNRRLYAKGLILASGTI